MRTTSARLPISPLMGARSGDPAAGAAADGAAAADWRPQGQAER
jgi:hypothetical protein